MQVVTVTAALQCTVGGGSLLRMGSVWSAAGRLVVESMNTWGDDSCSSIAPSSKEAKMERRDSTIVHRSNTCSRGCTMRGSHPQLLEPHLCCCRPPARRPSSHHQQHCVSGPEAMECAKRTAGGRHCQSSLLPLPSVSPSKNFVQCAWAMHCDHTPRLRQRDDHEQTVSRSS